jgi:hypothetical protein
MEITTISPDETKTNFFTLSAPGTFVGATVSAIVFTTITTTGEIAAASIGTGIDLTGNILAYGTELTVGSFAATTIRNMTRTYSAIARPTISNTSRISALGISVVAGAGAALTTSILIYGGKQFGSYLYSCYEEYKQKVANTIQHPIELSSEVLLIEDDIQLIEEEPPKMIEMKTLVSTHSLQDD